MAIIPKTYPVDQEVEPPQGPLRNTNECAPTLSGPLPLAQPWCRETSMDMYC